MTDTDTLIERLREAKRRGFYADGLLMAEAADALAARQAGA